MIEKDMQEAYELYCMHYHRQQNDETEENFANDYIDKCDSKESYIGTLLEKHNVPSWVQTHLNMEEMTRELFSSDYLFLEGKGNGYVFYAD